MVMKLVYRKIVVAIFVLLFSGIHTTVVAQAEKTKEKFRKASKKIERGFKSDNKDTLAQGYFDLGENYYQKGDLIKSESYYQKSKDLFEKMPDAEGIAKSSRALGKVQEELHKKMDALKNYYTAQTNNAKTGDIGSSVLNGNDITRLSKPDSIQVQQKILKENINLGLINKDTNEIVTNYSLMADMSVQNNWTDTAVGAYRKAYDFSKNNPSQALRYNQLITDVYLKDKNYPKAIETKQEILKEGFVQNSTLTKATEITSLAAIYILKNEDSTATRLLNEAYAISVENGHTLEAKKCVEKLDSIFQQQWEKGNEPETVQGFFECFTRDHY